MQTIIDIREIEIDIEFTRYSGYLIEALKVHFISGVDKKIKEEKLFYILCNVITVISGHAPRRIGNIR